MRAAPRVSYLICGTPRAGTGYLAGLLMSTGLAGRPEEHLWEQPALAERWGTSSFAEFVAAMLERGTTGNGVFGTKVMWGYLDDVIARARTLPAARPGMRDPDLLELAFPRLRYVFIWRADVAAQAVSHTRAIQDGIWYGGDTRAPGPTRFDFAMIDGIAEENARHNAEWRRWFTRHGITPFTVQYEHLVRTPREAALALLRWLGVEAPAGVRVAERWSRQADELNERWLRRYQAIRSPTR